VSRGTWEPVRASPLPFVYRAITFYGSTFLKHSTRYWFGNLPSLRQETQDRPRYSIQATPAGLHLKGLGYFPLRSPLLRESRLIYFPAGTEMFQFPAFTSIHLCIQWTTSGY
jgi:hypothetical protein